MEFDYPQQQQQQQHQQHHQQHQQHQQQQQHQQHQQHQQWLLQQHHPHPGQSAFPSPVSPPTTLSDTQYQPYYHSLPQHPHDTARSPPNPNGNSGSNPSLSLNLSSLSVASPTNLSPINPSPLHTHSNGIRHHQAQGGHAHSHSVGTGSAMSPVTPISPSNSSGAGLQYGHHGMQQAFQFGIPESGQAQFDANANSNAGANTGQQQHQFELQPQPRRGLATGTATSSRSSSSSEVEKSVPRKRSFSANPHPALNVNVSNLGVGGVATPTSLATSLEEGTIGVGMFDIGAQSQAARTSSSPLSRRGHVQAYDEMDTSGGGGYGGLLSGSNSNTGTGNGGSPIDGNISPSDGAGSGSGGDEHDRDHMGIGGIGGMSSMGMMGGMGMGDGDDDIEGERDDQLKPLEGVGMDVGGSGSGGGMSVLGKPMGTNNFVTKLYQMINDSTSSRFISWTELGTSFVVSNVGEFSRSILGSHFKHNNFSSFVRQLNMYGFHKINRTPRSQRTSTDAQTWEFSHHKFLRGRPDLLDEIKRKALEPDPGVKHRVELPGEMIVMREENRRVWDALMGERRKVERLAGVVKLLWDVVGKGFPGSVPPFPADLLEPSESPNIYITSPTTSGPPRFPPPLSTSLSSQSLHSLHSMSSPNSSPTTAEFPNQMHPPPNAHAPASLSRQHSFQQMVYPGSSASSTPLPSSPGSVSMDLFEGSEAGEGRANTKRQRTSNENLTNGVVGIEDPSSSSSGTNVKRMSRARSDSAPLGYGLGAGLNASWQGGGTRPRSGSGLAGRGMGMGMPGVGAANRSNGGGSGTGTPLLSLPNLTQNSPGR